MPSSNSSARNWQYKIMKVCFAMSIKCLLQGWMREWGICGGVLGRGRSWWFFIVWRRVLGDEMEDEGKGRLERKDEGHRRRRKLRGRDDKYQMDKCSEHNDLYYMTTLQRVYIANEGIYAKQDKTALNARDERLYTTVSSLSSAINFSNSASSA
jgi:hypothetical protein